MDQQPSRRKQPSLSARHADPHSYPHGIAFMDGQYLPMSEAKISVLDYGFLHSDATYDTVHVWNGCFFRLDLHLDRFFGGLEKLRMTIPFDRDGVAEILHACVASSGHRAAYVEMLCTRGASPTFSRDPRDAVNRFMAFAIPLGSVANAEQMRRGLRVAISDRVRIPPASIDSAIKNYHWLDLVLGLYDAYDQGGETALILDFNGNVAEGPGFNVFVVKDGKLSTPGSTPVAGVDNFPSFNVFVVKDGKLSTPATGVLPGITRRTVFDLCAGEGLSATAADVGVAALREADEVFITSTAGGIMPVTIIDGAPVGDGQVGPITRRLTTLYWDRHEDPAWSSPVRYP